MAKAMFGWTAETRKRVWAPLQLSSTVANGSSAPHGHILAEQVVELLELDAEHAHSPMIKFTANDGTIKVGQCSWDQFRQMPRALEIYRRDGGKSLNSKVKLMIVLYCILGKQAWTHW